MHPADQFEAFRELGEERGFGAEEIANAPSRPRLSYAKDENTM
jgi:hypothetical protein